MSTKPVVFKPTLYTPQGINNYSGAVFRCFTKGDTLPFKFTLGNSDGAALDVTGWTVTVVMANKLDYTAGNCGDAATQLVEVDIPLLDLATGTFEGDVTDEHTGYLPVGINYAIAKYTTAAGATHIIDMCTLEVYPNLIESV